jgi:transposase
LDPVKPWIDEVLRADLAAPRKQRHTVRRIYDRLRVERGFAEVSYTTLRAYVVERRRDLLAEDADRRRHIDGMVPQRHEPGAEAEVDFADVWVRLAGVVTKCYLFTLRLSCSGKAVHRVFASQGQEAFLEGHVEAFGVLGGVPTGQIRYDNLKPAVRRVCFGRSRVESARWVAFRSFYGFDAFYCLPGVEGAHEKGGVENEGGRFRRNHLVPVPEVDLLAELNERLAEIDAAEDARHIDSRPTSVGHDFQVEAGLLAPLPGGEFDCGLTLSPLVGRDARVTVRQCHYSAPARHIGRRVRVSLRANELLVLDRGQVVARHPRLSRRGDYHDCLDHYLEILLVKPGALAGSTALAAARAEGGFTPAHDAFWAAARAAHGDAAGTRALVEVLLLHRRMPAEAVAAGIAAALRAGSHSPDVVAIEARKALSEPAAGVGGPDIGADIGVGAGHGPHTGQPALDPASADVAGEPPATVISLHSRRPALPEDTRPLPSVAVYDQLLTRRPKGTA